MNRVKRVMKNVGIITAGVLIPYVVTYLMSTVGVMIRVETVSLMFIGMLSVILIMDYVLENRKNRKLLNLYGEILEHSWDISKRKDDLIDSKNEYIKQLQREVVTLTEMNLKK